MVVSAPHRVTRFCLLCVMTAVPAAAGDKATVEGSVVCMPPVRAVPKLFRTDHPRCHSHPTLSWPWPCCP